MKIEDIQVNTHVAGIEPSGPVEILHVERAGDTAVVTYSLLASGVLQKTMFRADEPKLAAAGGTLRQFHGTISVAVDDPIGSFGEIVQNVIEHFSSEYGTEVAVTVDIEARRPGGFDVKTVRVVKENAATLKFRTAEFEEE